MPHVLRHTCAMRLLQAGVDARYYPHMKGRKRRNHPDLPPRRPLHKGAVEHSAWWLGEPGFEFKNPPRKGVERETGLKAPSGKTLIEFTYRLTTAR